ncbi:MAG: hypothetical protein ACK4UJ_04180 [Leptonema sp. (in: bacteria)]
MFKKLLVVVLFIFESCFLIFPEKINVDQILDIEKDLIGSFKGIRFYFNRFNENQGFGLVNKKCQIEQKNNILCQETYIFNNSSIHKKYCFFYDYQTSQEAYVKFNYNCSKDKNFLLNLSGKEKIRGGGFMLYAFDRDPKNLNKIYPISFYLTKGEKGYFYEEKNYYFFFFFLGKEITIWEKTNDF